MTATKHALRSFAQDGDEQLIVVELFVRGEQSRPLGELDLERVISLTRLRNDDGEVGTMSVESRSGRWG